MSLKNRNFVDQKYLRDVPGWKDAPVPICMGGDFRALTFCCKPGHSLSFGFKCLRDKTLKEIGLSQKEFMRIKDEFSVLHDWDSSYPCFGSLTYCCMRRNGCFRRDTALAQRYPGKNFEESLEAYFTLKKELAKLILQAAERKEQLQNFE